MVQKNKAVKVSKTNSASTGSSFDNLELFLLHLPTTIWYLIFCYAPMFGVVISFMDYKVKPGKSFLYSLFVNSRWNGFGNFKFLMESSYFETMLRNTLVYNLIFITLGVVIPVTLAIMMSQLYSKRMAKICQTAMFLPHFLSWVVIGYFVFAFFTPGRGLVNNLAKSLGIGDPAHDWYQDITFWSWFLVFLNQWKGMGYNMVVYMASISGIDQEMYEAALIDGSSPDSSPSRCCAPLFPSCSSWRSVPSSEAISAFSIRPPETPAPSRPLRRPSTFTYTRRCLSLPTSTSPLRLLFCSLFADVSPSSLQTSL